MLLAPRPWLSKGRGQQLRERFAELEAEFDEAAAEIEVPDNLADQIRAILNEHNDLRWDDAIVLAIDDTRLDNVREEKRKARQRAGDFTGDDGDDEP